MRWLTAVLVALCVCVATRFWGVAWGPHHAVRASRATLSAALRSELHRRGSTITTTSKAIDVALDVVGERLFFGLGHPTRLHFDARREAHCIEYSELFAQVFNGLASRGRLDAHAWSVRSAPALLWGVPLSVRSLRDHDWNIVEDGHAKHFIDAAFADAWLGGDVSSNVRGAVIVPHR